MVIMMMNQKSLKINSIALVLCILCSVCVAPVMAGTPANAGQGTHITADGGVHLVKIAGQPTQLDLHYYSGNVAEDFVVDGDQFYWVRIGNVKAKELSSNDIANLVCRGIIMAVGGAATGVVTFAAIGGEIGSEGAATPFIWAALGGAIGGIMTFHADTIANLCPKIEKLFVDNRYRAVASDGTILVMLEKVNWAGIDELRERGIKTGGLMHYAPCGATSYSDYDFIGGQEHYP